jgi:hypothetical protein
MLLISVLLYLLSSSALSAEPVIIHGYTDRISVFPGDSVELYIHATFAIPRFTMNLYNLNGNKAATWEIPIFKTITNSPLLAGTDLRTGDILACPSDDWTAPR